MGNSTRCALDRTSNRPSKLYSNREECSRASIRINRRPGPHVATYRETAGQEGTVAPLMQTRLVRMLFLVLILAPFTPGMAAGPKGLTGAEARGEAEVAFEDPAGPPAISESDEGKTGVLPAVTHPAVIIPSKPSPEFPGAEAAGEAEAILEAADEVTIPESTTSLSAPKTATVGGPNKKAAYVLGFRFGQTLRLQGLKVAAQDLLPGLNDGLLGGKSTHSPEEMNEILREFQGRMHDLVVEENQNKGKKFLESNGKKEGVVTLPSGLQYKIVRDGKGSIPAASDSVVTHYSGTLIDGNEFDSSYSRGEPAEFPVNRVIAGWTEALQLMKVGAKWELYIPSNLAYGPRGSPPKIGPEETLIFTVELLEIKSK